MKGDVNDNFFKEGDTMYLLIFLIVICFFKWKYYLKKNNIPYKYFYPTLVMGSIYIVMIQINILIEGHVYILFFGGMTALFYISGLLLGFKRGCHFLEIMDKHYPRTMYKFNMSTKSDKFKAFDKELEHIEENAVDIVKEAILQRNLIKPTMLLHIELIIIMTVSDITYFS